MNGNGYEIIDKLNIMSNIFYSQYNCLTEFNFEDNNLVFTVRSIKAYYNWRKIIDVKNFDVDEIIYNFKEELIKFMLEEKL